MSETREASSDGRVALVSGAAGGIGRGVSMALAEAGFSLALAGRTASTLRTLGDQLVARDVAVEIHPGDLTREEEVEALASAVRARWDRLDLLVHAAGFGRFHPLQETSAETWQRTIAVNLTSVFLLTRAALPLLLRGRSPRVIAITSVAGRKTFPNCAAYCASKRGLMGLLDVMREEFRPRGIGVTAILPGATDTAFWDRVEGEWDRARMITPAEVGRQVVNAALAPAGALVEEIVVGPSGGDL